MKLSIIVSVYNVEKYLRECLDSILCQEFSDFELIIVNDGSTDDSLAICNEYKTKDRRIRVIDKSNGGVSSARNAGIDVALGEYIAFVDSDDYIVPSMFNIMLSTMIKDDLDIICADTCVEMEGRLKLNLLYKEERRWTGEEALHEILCDRLDNSSCNKLYRRDLFSTIRYPEGRVFEDVATIYKLVAASRRVGYIPQALYHYKRRKGSIISSSFDKRGRYHAFLSYRERYEFATERNLPSKMFCLGETIKKALGYLTATYNHPEDINPDWDMEVRAFLDKYGKEIDKSHLSDKTKGLLWGYQHGERLNIAYAKLSRIGKRFKTKSLKD